MFNFGAAFINMTVNPRHSFKLKLCVNVLCASLIAFFLILSGSLYFTTREIRDSVSNIVTSKLQMATKALDGMLNGMKVASDNLIGVINSPLMRYEFKNADVVGQTFLESNRHIQGLCIGYEDGTIYGHPGPWCPYLMRSGDNYIFIDLAEKKDFRASEWYKTPAESRMSGWSEPFMESNGTMIVSYNVPVIGDDGRTECVFAVDQNLNALSDSLQTLRPYEGSALYLIDKTGRYIAHPDHGCVLDVKASENIVAFAMSEVAYITEGSGKEKSYIFKSPVPETGWTVLLSVPESAMVGRSQKMMKVMLVNMLIGLLLLLAGSLFVINRLTKPLEKFASAARQISHGDFDVDLPVIKDRNELYDLRVALASMKVSLDEYISKLEDTSRKKASIERELDIARAIQMAMVPKIFPPYPERDNLDIFASLTPAQAVGGDLYDFVLLEDKFFFCIGDVSGKGVPASLLMAITRTLFRNTASVDKTPSQIARILNDAIADGNEMGMFVTMMICSYDLVSGELKICNCGHNLPVTNGSIVDPVSMKAVPDAEYHLINHIPTNIAVGVVPGFEYRDVTMNITPGCMLLLYTDGVTEAENARHDLFEESRMISCLKSMPKDSTSREIVEKLVNDVNGFVGDAQRSDDITLLCLRCNHL